MSVTSSLKPSAANPAIHPELTASLVASVESKATQVSRLLSEACATLKRISFANSFSAEDMVLTDIILRKKLPISLFSLDTGRLPVETYDLMARVEAHYQTKLTLYFPQHESVNATFERTASMPFTTASTYVKIAATCARWSHCNAH